jgi:eukaryotic-like serine/threonine-protein kinase
VTTTAGRVIHRICPSCDLELGEGVTGGPCPRCGTKLVEIREVADDLIGAVIDDRFEIRDRLGQGGMGTVYRAWQRSVGREVAIKLIDRAYSSDPMSVRRFLREARLASQLSQPNTVSVFDFGQAADGRLFIAMELIRGRTLHKVIEADGTFSIERTVRIGVQICDALEAAHTAGIIHRDLKLENVIVLDHPPGRDLLKVLDFGLAKNIREPGSHGTESGVVVGTPRYMAPEAAMDGESLPAGDLYALGVILGELAAGKPLWEGENLPHLVSQKLDPEPAIRMVPPPLARIVGALIDPEPERRPTAPQAREMLVAALDGPGADETLLDPEPASKDTVSLRTPRPTPAVPPSDELAARAVAASEPAPGAAAAVSGTAAVAPVAPVSVARTAATAKIRRRDTRRRRVVIGIGFVAIALGVATGAVLALGRRHDHAATRSAADAAMVAPAPDGGAIVETPDATAPGDTPGSAAQVTLHVITEPAGATVTIVGGTAAGRTSPSDLVVPSSTTKLVLRATLRGHAAKRVDVIPDHDQDVVLKLDKLARDRGDRLPF